MTDDLDFKVPTSRERYFKEKKVLNEAIKRSKEIEEQENTIFSYFSKLFFDDDSKKHIEKVKNALSGYTIQELSELYEKLRLLKIDEVPQEKIPTTIPFLDTLAFVSVFTGTTAIAMVLISLIVLKNIQLINIIYSLAVGIGTFSILYSVQEVIKIVKAKKKAGV